MPQKPESLILEILRRLQADMADLKEGQRHVQVRLTSIEERLAGVEGRLATLHGDIAVQHRRIDYLEDRLARVERRLELSEPPSA